LSQYTRVTDRRTDRRTDKILITIPRLHYMQRGKNWAWRHIENIDIEPETLPETADII